MSKSYDLDDILISPRIYSTWMGMLGFQVAELRRKYPDLQPEEIPDERFSVGKNGVGRIYVTVRQTTISLNVPKSEWRFK